jgi:hypothetical protein
VLTVFQGVDVFTVLRELPAKVRGSEPVQTALVVHAALSTGDYSILMQLARESSPVMRALLSMCSRRVHAQLLLSSGDDFSGVHCNHCSRFIGGDFLQSAAIPLESVAVETRFRSVRFRQWLGLTAASHVGWLQGDSAWMTARSC